MNARSLLLSFFLILSLSLAGEKPPLSVSPPQTEAVSARISGEPPMISPAPAALVPQKLKLKWKLGQASNAPFGAGSPTYATPTVSESGVYAGYVSDMQRAGFVFGSNADTGEKIWETRVEGTDQMKLSLDRHAEFLVCVTSTYDKWHVHCLNKNTGSLVWKAEKQGKVQYISIPAVTDRTVCIEIGRAGDKRDFVGFEKTGGKEIWAFEARSNSQGDTSAHEEDRLYTVANTGNNGIVQSLDINTGRPIWTYQTGNAPLRLGCVSTKGKIFVTTQAFSSNRRTIEVHCLDGGTGTLIWKSEVGGESVAYLPAVSGDRLFIATRMSLPQGAIYCLEASSGKFLWKFALDENAVPKSSPAVSENHVYVTAQSGDYYGLEMKGFLYGLDISSGDLNWRFVTKGKGTLTSPPVLYGDYLFCAAAIERKLIGFVYCFDRNTGERIRRMRTGRTIVTDPMIGRRILFAGTVDGYIYAFAEGNVLIGRIGLVFALAGLFLQFVFALFQGTIHKRLDRRAPGPAYERKRRYQKRLDYVERAFDKVDRLSRSLSGGSGLLIINVYIGWLIMFLFFLLPLSAVYYLLILIPLDPWFPKWWPFAAYGFNAAILAALVFLI